MITQSREYRTVSAPHFLLLCPFLIMLLLDPILLDYEHEFESAPYLATRQAEPSG